MKPKIVLIGAGNVGYHLGLALKRKRYSIVQVYSKKRSKASSLAKLLGAKSSTSLPSITKDADLYIIAVSDDAIESVVQELKIPANKLVVHTSGSVSSKVIQNKFQHYGVLYPLQTFSKGVSISFKDIPICIHAGDKSSFSILESIAAKLSKRVENIDDEQRKIIHLSAVFVNNFSNHVYTVAEDILETKNLDFQILLPLIKETVNKLTHLNPKDAQTGPARRKDTKVIANHLKKLHDNPEYKKVYKVLSESILKFYS